MKKVWRLFSFIYDYNKLTWIFKRYNTNYSNIFTTDIILCLRVSDKILILKEQSTNKKRANLPKMYPLQSLLKAKIHINI